MIIKMNQMKMIKKQIYLALCFFILCIYVLGSSINTKAADSDNISTEVTYGFEAITKLGYNAPITISISNKGSEINGSVQIILSSLSDSNASNGTILGGNYKEKNYMFEKKVTIGANTTTDISFVIPIINRNNTLRITIFNEYKEPINTKDLEIEAEDYSYYVYAAILCDEATIINYFQNTALYQYNDYTFKGIILNKEDIPVENYGLELFNVLIISQSQLDNLSKEQQNTIYNWQKNGGFIVNTNTIENKQDVSWENIIPEYELKKIDYSYRSYEQWSISYALSNVFMNNIPDFTVYVVLIIIYIVFMGPVLYVILKKLNKRRFFWLCEIVGSILFTIIIIGLGSSTRLNAPFINYFNIISYNPDTINDSVYFNIQAPFNNEYKLYLDKAYSIKPIYDPIYMDDKKKLKKLDDFSIGISNGEQENTIAIRDDAAFTKEYFYAEKSEESNGEEYINVKMNMFSDKVTGTVTNNLDYPIEDAAILQYNKVIFLDTIPANSSVSLENMEIFTYNPKFKYGLTDEITGLKTRKNGVIEEGYMLQNQKKTILDFFVEKKFGVNTNKAYLIGFTSDMNRLDLQLDSAYDAYGMTMIEVPIEVDYTSNNQEYTAYVPIKNEEYSYSGDVMYSDEMILTYNLGENLTDIDLYFNDLSYYDKEYYKTFSGHVYFYNRMTTLYDPVDLSNKLISTEELKPYLNEENDIVIKYVEHFDKEEKQALLPSLSTIGRANNVKN